MSRRFAFQAESVSHHTALTLAGAAFVLSFILRQIPLLGWLMYPFQLFVTLIHELSHGLTAILTGGRFLRFTISPLSSGAAITAGGWRWLIIPAGYIGAALFGGALLVLTQHSARAQQRRWLAIGLGLFFGFMTVLFARSPVAFLTGTLLAVALMSLGYYGSQLWLTFGLDLLAIQCILNAFDSLLGLIRVNFGPFRTPNDAQAMAQLTHVPAFFWALLWTFFSLAILIGGVYLSFRREKGMLA
jgi:hypothetical protein